MKNTTYNVLSWLGGIGLALAFWAFLLALIAFGGTGSEWIGYP